MSVTFTKLFSSITESTVWCEPAGTRLVWIAMLAKADSRGRVFASVPGLANLARVTLDEAVRALETLAAPDRWSRTPDHEGRRIEPIDGGWRLLNHAKYRELRDEETRREQNRDAKRRQRERESGEPEGSEEPIPDDGVSNDADNQPTSAQAEAEVDLEDQQHAQAAPAPSRAERSAPTAERFPEFWQVWPQKVGKAPALRSWKAKKLDRHADAIIADVRRRIAHDCRWREGFITNPATYLNQERWLDDLPLERGKPVPGAPASTPAPERDWRQPQETPFERAANWARQQHHIGMIDAARRDELIAEAKQKHGAPA